MLREIERLLLRFKSEIAYSSGSISEIIHITHEYEICRIAAAFPVIDRNPCMALHDAGEIYFPFKDDRKWFEDFVAGIGESDTQSQLEHIELHKELLKRNTEAAVKEYEDKSKLYLALGLFGGILICAIIV